MADNEKTDHAGEQAISPTVSAGEGLTRSIEGDEKSKEQYDKEEREWKEKILQQLKNKELEDNVKIILVIGLAGAGKTSLVKLITGEDLRLGHKLDDGTVIPTLVPVKIDGERYVFIDSPGFGHAAAQPGEIKKQIQAILGYFTRALGGVHGILYVQDIMVERTMPGMNEAIDFLNELAGRTIRPHITFITTKWDIPKLLRKWEDREVELKDITWAEFRVGAPGGSRYFRHGVDCVEDSQQVQELGRDLLWSNVMAHYKNASAQSLIMPFSEWTYMEQGFKVATVAGKVIFVGAGVTFLGFLALLIHAGAPVTIGLSFTIFF